MPGLDTWMILEATPADTNALDIPPAEAQAPAAAPTEEVPEPTEAQPRPSAGTAPALEPAAAKEQGPAWLGALGKTLLLLAAAAALLEGQRTFRIRLRRQRQRKGTTNAQALARWQEAEQLAKLLKTQPPRELEALAQKAKFSQHTLTAEELASFESYLRTARKRLRQMPWYMRLLQEYVFAIY